MFIKKDRRSIREIIFDEGTTDAKSKDDDKPLTILKLSKRIAEFEGSLIPLCQDIYVSKLACLKVLNLYDNALEDLSSIGYFAFTQLEDLNLGCNKLRSIPTEIANIKTLKTIWLEDNEFDEFPTAVCQIKGLKTLRLSGNNISVIPEIISNLESLELLALDNNQIVKMNADLLKLSNLKHLWLRQNKIFHIPEEIKNLTSLETLCLSSNQIEDLPDDICAMERLKYLYINGNKITTIPSNLPYHPTLQEVNLANNRIEYLPLPWITTWGIPDEKTGQLKKATSGTTSQCSVNVFGNQLRQSNEEVN